MIVARLKDNGDLEIHKDVELVEGDNISISADLVVFPGFEETIGELGVTSLGVIQVYGEYVEGVELQGEEIIAPLDKVALDNKKAEANNLTKADYTIETWNTLEIALGLPEETQEQVDTKLLAITNAISNLVEVVTDFDINLSFSESYTGSRPRIYSYTSNNFAMLRATTLHLNMLEIGTNVDMVIYVNESARTGTSFVMNEGDTIGFRFTNRSKNNETVRFIINLDSPSGYASNSTNISLRASANSGCYLTTAMVEYYGLEDDGIELTAMRELRSHSGYKYQDVLEEYSQASPMIIRGIEQSEDKDYYYSMIKDVVDNIVIWVADEEWEKAETAYLDLYYYLKERFGGV